MKFTPLRYPGGKQKLAPFLFEVIRANKLAGCSYVEPFAGGAGAAIALLFKGYVSKVHLNDACLGVYSFWSSVLSETDAFCKKIDSAVMSVEEWRRQKEILLRPDEFSEIQVGFSLFYLNRVNRSGIVASGGLIGGLRQDGDWKMDVRFNKKDLIRRVEAIASRRKSINVYRLDAEIFLKECLPSIDGDPLLYCDPPYYCKADKLYLNYYKSEDHERLARAIQKIPQRWIVSYDAAPQVIQNYPNQRSFIYDLQYNAGKAYKGREVLIFSDDLEIPRESALPSLDVAVRAHHRVE